MTLLKKCNIFYSDIINTYKIIKRIMIFLKVKINLTHKIKLIKLIFYLIKIEYYCAFINI
jgi:hypothetical protein